MDARLIVVDGSHSKREVRLRLPVTIGRDREADLTIVHPTVSRRHCELFERDGLLMVVDCGSLNGTIVGDHRVTEAVLRPGDRLTVGPITFVTAYELAGSVAVPASSARGGASPQEHAPPRSVADDNDDVPALDEESLEFDRLLDNEPAERGEVIVPAIDAVARRAPWLPAEQHPALDANEDSSEVFPLAQGLAADDTVPRMAIPAALRGDSIDDTLVVLPAQRAADPQASSQVPAAASSSPPSTPPLPEPAAQLAPAPEFPIERDAGESARAPIAAEALPSGGKDPTAEVPRTKRDALSSWLDEIPLHADAVETMAAEPANSAAVADDIDLENLPDLDELMAELGPFDLSDVLPDGPSDEPADDPPLSFALQEPAKDQMSESMSDVLPLAAGHTVAPSDGTNLPGTQAIDGEREALLDFGEPHPEVLSEGPSAATAIPGQMPAAEEPDDWSAAAAEAAPDFGDPRAAEGLSFEFATLDHDGSSTVLMPAEEEAHLLREFAAEEALPDFGEANPLPATELEVLATLDDLAVENVSDPPAVRVPGDELSGHARDTTAADGMEIALADEDWLAFDSLDLPPAEGQQSSAHAATPASETLEPPRFEATESENLAAIAGVPVEPQAELPLVEETQEETLPKTPYEVEPRADESAEWFDTLSNLPAEPAVAEREAPLASWLVDEVPAGEWHATVDVLPIDPPVDALPEFEVDAAELPAMPSSEPQAVAPNVSFEAGEELLISELHGQPQHQPLPTLSLDESALNEIELDVESLTDPLSWDEVGASRSDVLPAREEEEVAAAKSLAEFDEELLPSAVPPAAERDAIVAPHRAEFAPNATAAETPPQAATPPVMPAARAKRRWWWPFEISRGGARRASRARPAPPAPAPSAPPVAAPPVAPVRPPATGAAPAPPSAPVKAAAPPTAGASAAPPVAVSVPAAITDPVAMAKGPETAVPVSVVPPAQVAAVVPVEAPSRAGSSSSDKPIDSPKPRTAVPSPRSRAAAPSPPVPASKEEPSRGWFRFWRRRSAAAPTTRPSSGPRTPSAASGSGVASPAVTGLNAPEVPERSAAQDAEQVLLDPLADYELLRPTPDPNARRVPRDAELERFLKDLG